MFGSLRSRLALAAVKRRLPKIMAADTVAELPDGLHVAIVGSGSPLPDPKRGNPCVAVIAAGRVYVVDAGEGASETLNRMGIVPSGIESVLLTHYHSDHIGGIGSVNLQRWVAEGETEPMRVIGPPGARPRHRRLQRGIRARRHLPNGSSRIGDRATLGLDDGRRRVLLRTR